MRRGLAQRILVWLLLALAGAVQAAPGLSIQLGSIQHPGFLANAASFNWQGNGKPAKLSIKQLKLASQSWQDITLSCPLLTVGVRSVSCKGASLAAANLPPAWKTLILDVQYDVTGQVDAVASAGGGKLALQYLPNSSAPKLQANFQAFPVAFFTALTPQLPVKINQGLINGRIDWQLQTGTTLGQFTVSQLAFADEAGEKAADGVAGKLSFGGKLGEASWLGRVDLAWQQGELYLAPFYAKASAQQPIQLGGLLNWQGDRSQWQLGDGQLTWPEIGQVDATLTVANGALTDLNVHSSPLALSPLYQKLLKSFLPEGGLLSDLDVQGTASISAVRHAGKWQSADLILDKTFAEDKAGRLALYGVSATIPWRAAAKTQPKLTMEGGKVLGLPFDATSLMLQVNSDQIDLPKLDIPLLGGKFSLNGLHLKKEADGWSGGLAGEISQVSMPKMSTAMGWPTIQGTLSASLPRIVFDPVELKAYGPIELDLFDGVSFLRNLKLTEPFGRAPRMTADLEMQNLDLGKLTKTFSFGAIEGKLDVSVDNLTLVDWQVSSFDAKVENSPGDYRKRISQRAVENIGELGGAGFSGALQRSFLRVFDSFGYSKLGWSCKLSNNVCQMKGVADAPNGYYLVVGGGVPAINVIGFNQSVHWSELIARIKRITEGGAPVMQ